MLSLLSGAALLTAVGLFSQLVGFGYRIVLSRLVGAETMGLYQLIMPVYSTLMSLTAIGLTVAVSTLSARYEALGDRGAVRQTRNRARALFFVAAIPLGALLVIFSDPISVYLLGDARTQLGIVLLVPCVLLTGVENLHKHCFYGIGQIRPPALTETVEQLIRTGAVLGLLILLLPLVLALILCSKRGISRVTACGVFAVGVLALGMTYSRASWVGMACAMVVLVFLWKPKLIPAFAVLCVVMVPFLPDTIWHRVLTIFNPADTSTASRIPLYQAALEVIRTSPVSGAGLGTAAVQDYISDFNLYHAEAPFVHAHNFYLQVWIEAGLLGFLGFVGSMLWNIKKAARTVRHCAPSAARTITCAGAAALCGAMVCGLADYLWNYPRVMCIFWFVFALTIAGIKVCRRETEAA